MTWFTNLPSRLIQTAKRFDFRLHYWSIAFTVAFLGSGITGQSQSLIRGRIVDSSTAKPLAYVNIGIQKKNIGTVSRADGTFSLQLPNDHLSDTLTFSLVGYSEKRISINHLTTNSSVTVELTERISTLDEVKITAKKPIEKKFGIKKRNLLLHFTDGMFSQKDIFEIGQLIKLGDAPAQVTSINLHLNANRKDSASFRINFYRMDGDQPGERVIEKSIIQRHPIKEGWLTFDLKAYRIFLKGNFLAAIEFIPEADSPPSTPIAYEVKLGGASRSFYRKNSLGRWNTPPHHYCIYVTALVDQSTPEDADDQEARPEFSYHSRMVNDTFSIFVQLPSDYNQNPAKRFPVLYHLDGNAYFDHIRSSLRRVTRKKKRKTEPILVGIGYRDAYQMDSLRVRDYTYPTALPADSFAVSGGGERFYSFITNELLPEIEKRYRVDTTHRTLMGHSFGGYFALFALYKNLTGTPVFDQLVAASPSLWYHDTYLLKQFETASVSNSARKNCKLFLTTGELEMAEYSPDTFSDLIRSLQKTDAVRVRYKAYKQLEHMGTAVPSFEDGIELFSGK
ncbi:alpha/beta hydrolase-fold protein [Larkinella insperata]|uniref:Alpha/beta hydrolase-fold protein n=1 Tax=Larkinella insperata TaxID=332158 RepID=A0ABW3QKQ0_9BACT|nr:alpha/beta hydrolase-fold protein [Larkinella insperata]